MRLKLQKKTKKKRLKEISELTALGKTFKKPFVKPLVQVSDGIKLFHLCNGNLMLFKVSLALSISDRTLQKES